MPSDLIHLSVIARELATELVGGRIDKITQPNSTDIVLGIRASGRNHSLLISVNPSACYVCLTERKFVNPLNAPSFCMHLRKHLTGGRIEEVSILGKDRIIQFSIRSRNEMKDEIEYKMIVELLGRYSNILLTKGGVITDCLRLIPLDKASEYRPLMPNLPYVLPENKKLTLDRSEDIAAAILGVDASVLPRFLYDNVSGVSFQTASEIVYRSGVTGEIDEAKALSVIAQLDEMRGISRDIHPCVLRGEGKYLDYFIYPYETIEGDFLPFDSLNAACDAYFGNKASRNDLAAKQNKLRGIVNAQIQKLKKKLTLVENKLLDAAEAGKYKSYADAIINSIYMIDPKAKVQYLPDYNDEACPTIKVPYDPALTPSQNAAAYYAKYSKLKRTAISNEAQKIQTLESLKYYESIAFAIDLTTSTAELDDISEELRSIGLIKSNDKKKKVAYFPTRPIRLLIDGFEILCGKNNLQNEKITFETASAGDLWLHAKSYHSAHTVVLTQRRPVPDALLLTAAKLTASMSSGKNSGKIEIDYTDRRYVKRHPSGKLGLVLYTDFHSVICQPYTEVELQKLLKDYSAD